MRIVHVSNVLNSASKLFTQTKYDDTVCFKVMNRRSRIAISVFGATFNEGRQLMFYLPIKSSAFDFKLQALFCLQDLII